MPKMSVLLIDHAHNGPCHRMCVRKLRRDPIGNCWGLQPKHSLEKPVLGGRKKRILATTNDTASCLIRDFVKRREES